MKKHARHEPEQHPQFTVGQQVIILDQMKNKPREFIAAVDKLTVNGLFKVRLGIAARPTTVDRVDFSDYSLDNLRGLSFEHITFTNAKLPNSDYAHALEDAGARLVACQVKGQAGTHTTQPKGKARPATPADGSHTAARQAEEDAAWTQYRGGRG